MKLIEVCIRFDLLSFEFYQLMKRKADPACRGDCLVTTAYNNTFRRVRDCSCLPQRCRNFLVCCKYETARTLQRQSGLCYLCLDKFGQTLTVGRLADCEICLERKRLVKLPGCGHQLCGPCVFRTQIGNADFRSEGDPVIVSDIEESSEYSVAKVPGWVGSCPFCRHRHI